MLEALQVVRYSLRDLWDEVAMLVLVNVVWGLALVLPAAPFLSFPRGDLSWLLPLALLLALPLPIITGGLCFFTNQVARGKAAAWGTFVSGVRRYWAKSLLVAAVNLVVLFLLALNLRFYSTLMQGTWTAFALGAWLILGLYWCLVQVFWFPMILELESEKTFLALRHALSMVAITPAFSLTLAVLMAAIGALCIALSLPVLFIMASLLLLIANHATRSRLAHVLKKPYRPGQE